MTGSAGGTDGERRCDSATVTVQALSSVLTIDCRDQRVREDFEADWSRCLTVAAGAEEFGLDPLVPDAYGHSLTSALTVRAIGELAGNALLFHAAGLADDDGRVLALVGASGQGKSTAAATLGKALGYVTDETVAVLEDGRVLPFPRPLALYRAHGQGQRKSQVGPDALGLMHAPDDLNIARIVLLTRDGARHGNPELETLGLLDAITELVPHTSALTALERPFQALCHLISRVGPVHRLTFGEVSGAVSDLRHLLSTRDGSTERWRDEPGPSADDPTWGLRDGRIRQKPFADGVVVGDEALILLRNHPVRLSGIGLTLWQAAADAPRHDELVERVVAAHGAHPNAEALVADAVRMLCEADVLATAPPRAAGALLRSPGAVSNPPEVRAPAGVCAP